MLLALPFLLVGALAVYSASDGFDVPSIPGNIADALSQAWGSGADAFGNVTESLGALIARVVVGVVLLLGVWGLLLLLLTRAGFWRDVASFFRTIFKAIGLTALMSALADLLRGAVKLVTG